MPHYQVHELGGFFKPESIAVIGVSREIASLGGTSFLQRHLDAEYAGRLYPINPKASEILGLKAYPSLSSLPEVPDLVMIAVRADLVPASLEECARKGVRYVHVLTAGFSETGTREGRELEKQLADVAEQHNLLVMGPNCMGPYCPASRLTAWGAIPGRDGHLGVISQSGGITQRFTEYVSSLGMDVSKAASIGNATVLDSPDFLEFMAGDDDIRLIAIYQENIRNGRRFFDLARELSPRKPIVMLKGGESEQGAATVESHTGRMAGNQRVWKAFFKQTGVVPVSNMNEWADACLTFSYLPKTRGRGVFIIGGGGGNSVISSDACIRAGLDVPKLSPKSMEGIRPFVPAAGSIAGNPLDHWELFLNPELLLKVLDIAYADPGISMVIVDRLIPRIAFHGPGFPDAVPEITGFIKTHPHRKPTVFTVDYDGGDPDLIRKGSLLRSRFCEAGVPAFPSFERAIGALARFQKYCNYFASL
ncbi:MAG: CoA-binding protein [Deltaproteobacteria bacterium]|nr:CoA-binding protein [Deltaproteobacteria bacterium]